MALSAAQVQAADAAFYAAAVRRSVKLPPIQVSSGQVVNVNMPKAGYGTYAIVTFNGTLSRTEGATVGTVYGTSSAPWNVFQNVNFTDYAGLTRLSQVSGAMLTLRRRLLSPRFGPALSQPNGEGVSPDNQPFNPANFYIFNVPNGTASSTTTAPLIASMVVPFSTGYRSVRGSYAFTVPDGASTLSFTIQPEITMAANGTTPDPFNIVTVPYVAGATTTVSVTGTVYITYYYYDAPAGTPAPVGEVSQVFELVRVRDTTNLVAGGIKQFVLQTGRTYLRVFQNLVLQGGMSMASLSGVKFLIDSATPTTDEDIYSYVNRMAQDYSQPLPDGWVVWDFSSKPWTPDSYGSLETDLSIVANASTGAPSYLDTTRECLYVSQQAPNLVQAGAAG